MAERGICRKYRRGGTKVVEKRRKGAASPDRLAYRADLEASDLLDHLPRLLRQFLSRLGRLIRVRTVVVHHFIDLADGLADLFDAGRLLARSLRNLFHELRYLRCPRTMASSACAVSSVNSIPLTVRALDS